MSRFHRTLLLLLISTASLRAYSVLSHEAIVDALWDVRLKGLILAKYPGLTAEQLKKAHGFALGGAIVQDLGYYPHGSAEFSDLTHYVRTGDFIVALVNEAHDANEFAFALGALSHYVSDIDGHRLGTNIGEPILYPKLGKKFGKVVTYEDDPATHLKTEFGFDVLEVARGNFAPEAYHDFIGFYVSKELVGRAFHDTYGLELSDLFMSFDLAVTGYRSAASNTIPLATRVAWAQQKKEIQKAKPGTTHRRFVYIMKRSSYEREWGKRIDQPNWFEHVLAVLLKIVPPIGPLKALRFKIPTPDVEQIFLRSFTSAVDQYSAVLKESNKGTLKLPDKNYDTGEFTPAGRYRLTDETYSFWLHKLATKKFAGVTPEIKQQLLTFYQNPDAPYSTKKNPDDWKRTLAELDQLRQTP